MKHALRQWITIVLFVSFAAGAVRAEETKKATDEKSDVKSKGANLRAKFLQSLEQMGAEIVAIQGKAAANEAGQKKAEVKKVEVKAAAKNTQTRTGIGAFVINPAAVQANEAEVDPMVAQWLQQFRPLLRGELIFIRQVCDLPPEVRPKVKAAGEEALLSAAKTFAKFQNNRRGAGTNPPQIRKLIHEGLTRQLQEVLSAEQMAKYNAEVAARTEQHKRTVILSVVSRLDGTLFLTAQQREKITDILSSKWEDKWESWLGLNQYGDMYFPQIPDACLLPCLNEEQKDAWRGLQKIDASYYFGGRIIQEADDEEWWENKPVPPPALKALNQWLKGIR